MESLIRMIVVLCHASSVTVLRKFHIPCAERCDVLNSFVSEESSYGLHNIVGNIRLKRHKLEPIVYRYRVSRNTVDNIVFILHRLFVRKVRVHELCIILTKCYWVVRFFLRTKLPCGYNNLRVPLTLFEKLLVYIAWTERHRWSGAALQKANISFCKKLPFRGIFLSFFSFLGPIVL